MHFFERRFSYLGGFGLPITVATLGFSFVTAAALYALLFPLLLLLAVKATPKDHKDPVCALGPHPWSPIPKPSIMYSVSSTSIKRRKRTSGRKSNDGFRKRKASTATLHVIFLYLAMLIVAVQGRICDF
jgi:hypothetical protein